MGRVVGRMVSGRCRGGKNPRPPPAPGGRRPPCPFSPGSAGVGGRTRVLVCPAPGRHHSTHHPSHRGILFCCLRSCGSSPTTSTSDPAPQASRMRLKSPVGFSDPGGADSSAPFTPALPGPGGGRGFLSTRCRADTILPTTRPVGASFFCCLRSCGSSPTTSTSDPAPLGVTDEAEKPGGLFRPRRRKLLCAVYPGSAGAGGRTRVLVCPAPGRHHSTHHPSRRGILFCCLRSCGSSPTTSTSDPVPQASRMRLKSPVGFSDPGGAEVSNPRAGWSTAYSQTAQP